MARYHGSSLFDKTSNKVQSMKRAFQFMVGPGRVLDLFAVPSLGPTAPVVGMENS